MKRAAVVLYIVSRVDASGFVVPEDRYTLKEVKDAMSVPTDPEDPDYGGHNFHQHFKEHICDTNLRGQKNVLPLVGSCATRDLPSLLKSMVHEMKDLKANYNRQSEVGESPVMATCWWELRSDEGVALWVSVCLCVSASSDGEEVFPCEVSGRFRW